MELYVLQAFNALSVSSILLLVALGLAFAFGLMGVINMAHGELIMAGAYTTYLLQETLEGSWLGAGATGGFFLLSLPASFGAAALLAYLLEVGLVRRLYGRPLDTLLATWGVSVILQQVARDLFGAPNVEVSSPAWLVGGVSFQGIFLPYKRLFILALAALTLVAVYLYLYRTAAGRRIRATMQDRSMAECLGISTHRVDSLTFALGGGLAGLAGCALTLLGPIGPALGTYYIVDAFLVVVLGGLGQLLGTVLAAGAIGTAGTFFQLSTGASVARAAVFALVIAFLQWRPAGLLAARTRTVD